MLLGGAGLTFVLMLGHPTPAQAESSYQQVSAIAVISGVIGLMNGTDDIDWP
jgi:hypothetical protein